jgi:hypothetical protein
VASVIVKLSYEDLTRAVLDWVSWHEHKIKGPVLHIVIPPLTEQERMSGKTSEDVAYVELRGN